MFFNNINILIIKIYFFLIKKYFYKNIMKSERHVFLDRLKLQMGLWGITSLASQQQPGRFSLALDSVYHCG